VTGYELDAVSQFQRGTLRLFFRLLVDGARL
jgi:hypothetical protein